MTSRSAILFLDWRDIRCGRLQWRTAEGRTLGVGNPPEPQVALFAHPHQVPHGIRLRAQPATTEGPVDGWKGWGRTIRDGGRYRSWHFEINGHTKLGSGAAAHARPPEDVFICGVESDDGHAWRQVSRSRIHLAGQTGVDGVTFFIDPAALPAQRYKVVYCARFPEGAHDEQVRAYLARPSRHRDARLTWQRRYGMFCAVSPDGEHWTSVNEPFMLHPSDTDTTVLWDESIERYVIYTRLFDQDRRWIGRAEAEDFRTWQPVVPMLWPRLDDPPDHDYYLNAYSHYPDLPEYRLMFPMVYHRFTERSDVHFFASADGWAWSQVPGGPVVVPGPPGAWDSEFLGSGKDLMVFGAGRVAIPYSGTSYPHKYPRWPAVWDAWNLGWAQWPQDRLCAVAADEEGELWTQEVTPSGGRLVANFRAPVAGQVRIGVEGVPGRSADDCDPLVGDQTARTVTWRGQTGLGTAGAPITLHVRLRRAELFSLRFS